MMLRVFLRLFVYWIVLCSGLVVFFFFNDTATTEIYTLSLHDALPICIERAICIPFTNTGPDRGDQRSNFLVGKHLIQTRLDRKSTRLNSSHGYISYAVFCLKKKTKQSREPSSPRHTVRPKTAVHHTTT